MIRQISVVYISRNAAVTLADSLDSVREFEDVVVWDNGSADDTLRIASSYPNVTVFKGDFMGFGPSKNFAATLAANDWILSLDTDEIVCPRLLAALRSWPTDDPHVVGEILRDNYFLGKAIRHGGWGGDWLVRLYHRHTLTFGDDMVHEAIRHGPDTRRVRMDGVLKHMTVTDLGQLLRKADHYSELRRTTTKCFPPWLICLKAAFAFIRCYFLQAGFLSGWRGLVIAWSNANGVFFKYFKVYADRKGPRAGPRDRPRDGSPSARRVQGATPAPSPQR